MIRIAWGNHVYPSEGFYQNLKNIQKALKAPGAESLNNRAKTPEMSASKGIQKNK